MNPSASINTLQFPFDEVFSVTPANLQGWLKVTEFSNFVPATQPIQDVDLIKQLSFIPGLKEILVLRQVHALEHATVWVLSELDAQTTETSKNQVDNELLGGLSTAQGFYLYGQVRETPPYNDGASSDFVNKAFLQRAVQLALQRLTSGEWNLAVHPRCGTNVSVGMLLIAGLALGFHLLLPRSPIEQLLGLGVAATTAAQLAPELGILAQRYVTTAIPFNLTIEDITVTRDVWGRSAHFVQVRWVD